MSEPSECGFCENGTYVETSRERVGGPVRLITPCPYCGAVTEGQEDRP